MRHSSLRHAGHRPFPTHERPRRTLAAAAWRTIPTWYLVSPDDHAINPDLERFYTKRMGAHTSEIKASHVAFISHPKEVVAFTEHAAMLNTAQ